MLRDKIQEACICHSVRLLVVGIWFGVNAAQVVICGPAGSQELVENVSIENNQSKIVGDDQPLDFHRLGGLLKFTILNIYSVRKWQPEDLKPFLRPISKAGWSKEDNNIEVHETRHHSISVILKPPEMIKAFVRVFHKLESAQVKEVKWMLRLPAVDAVGQPGAYLLHESLYLFHL